jgi:beta-glucanase (GH16 family)
MNRSSSTGRRTVATACVLVAACAVGAAAGAAALPGDQVTASQTASLQMLPQLAAVGSTPQPASAALSAMTAVLTPVSSGRPVLLQRRRDRKWVTVAQATEDADGRVSFTAPYAVSGAPATYRVLASATATLAQVSSAAARTDVWGTPLLTDNFAGTALADPWGQRLQGYVGNRQCSRADPSATAVTGGVLRLSVIDDPARGDCTDPQGRVNAYRLNGHVGTQGRFAFRYGFAAARVRFQPLRGQHGAFWMQPDSPAVVGGDPSVSGAEIDTIEWFGTGSGGLSSNAYYYRNGVLTKVGGWVPDQTRFGSGWADQFHVFSVEWTPTEYVFRIDGQVSFRTTEGVSQVPEYLILSLLSSDYELSLLGGTQNLPQTMQVDWVRVWHH